ncbi:MAG: HAMP domain-containing histidine kinase, partial [Solirubrobacterales bacterium]|nr:HAMP domain-containing histidine kinase [Solirubrobacterales bacterium]
MRHLTRTAVFGLVAAAVVALSAAPALADARPTLVVSPGHPAEASYLAPLSRQSTDPAFGLSEVEQVNFGYPPPDACARVGCDVIPVELAGALGTGQQMLAVTVTWWPQERLFEVTPVDRIPAMLVALWDRGGTHGSWRRLDAIFGRHAGHATVRLDQPTGTQYAVTVMGLVSGIQLSYDIKGELISPTPWPLDSAGAGTSASGGAAAPTGATRGRAAGSRGSAASALSPAGSDPALPLATRLNGMRPVSSGGLLASISHTLPWLAVLVAVVLLVAMAFRLRRQVRPDRRGVTVRARVSSWFSNLRLFWKLLVPFVAVLLVIGISGAYLTVHYLASRADTTVNQNLLQRSVSAQTYLRDQELYLLEAERFAANLEGVPEATAAGNQAELRKDLASAVAVRKDLDVLAATDATGQGLVNYLRDGASFTAQGGVAWSDAPAVKEVLAGVSDATGDKRTSFVRLSDGSVLLVTAGPIRTDHVVGAAVAALSADGLAKGAAVRARGTVGLYDLGGHAMGISKAGALPTTLSAPEARGSLRVRHGSTATLYEPFVVRGTKVGTVAVAIPTGSAYASVRGAALRLGLLVALAMAAVVGFGVLVSRYILRTVEPLVETNRALGQGDLSVRAPVRSGDELGELAQGFNLMAEQLQASYGELERRVAERTEELQRLYSENVKAGEARSQFFATISHEFRTPLFAILANAELLADPSLGPESPEETAEFAGTIQASAHSLLERVNELLDLARSESAGVELDAKAISLAATWAGIAPGVRALARAGELSITDDVSASLPQVQADAGRLRQILLNLTSNAVKYTRPGGRIRVWAREADGVLEVAVSDTGQGIPKRVGERVFEPYYRVKGSRAQGGQASSGLGLALTKRLVEAHGGRIWFESSRTG